MATWSEPRPGDVIRYYDGTGASAIHRAGHYIRTITRGQHAGELELQVSHGRAIRVHPSRVITPKEPNQ